MLINLVRAQWCGNQTSGRKTRPQGAGPMSDEIKTAGNAVGPEAYSWITYAWVVALSAWGGLVRFLNTLRTRSRSWPDAGLHLIIGLVTSIFVGVITFYLCEAIHLNQLWTAVFVAATGHMGAEGIKVFEESIKLRIRRFLGLADKEAK